MYVNLCKHANMVYNGNMNTARRIVLIFIIAFALNAFWEFWHAQFYIHYQGGAITALILLRAAMVDATIISAITLCMMLTSRLQRGVWFMIAAGLVIAAFLELWALSTNRWAYNETMPLIPFLHIGLTPTVQLALLGTISWFVARALYSRK